VVEVYHREKTSDAGPRRSSQPSMCALVDLTVQALDDARSSVSIDVDFEGHGIGKLLVPLVVRRPAAKEMPANVARLKGRLESSSA
jgi:hypothetical protein